MAADTQSPIVGSTYRFQLTATKDGSAWTLTGATTKLYLTDPSGNVSEHATTGGSGATRYYDSAAGDLDEPGNWRRSWHVTDGSVVQESAPIDFVVQASPGG